MPDQVVREGERMHVPDLTLDRVSAGMYTSVNPSVKPQTFVQVQAANVQAASVAAQQSQPQAQQPGPHPGCVIVWNWRLPILIWGIRRPRVVFCVKWWSPEMMLHVPKQQHYLIKLHNRLCLSVKLQ